MSDVVIYSIAIVGGFFAGILNTLAGNGSVVTLGILTELLGLPANIANGTNRIGLVFQTTISYFSLRKNVEMRMRDYTGPIIVICISAIIGAITAILIPNEDFTSIYRYLMVIMLFAILAKPSRWLTPEKYGVRNLPPWATYLFYIGIGFYGGFIQMGMGLIFLAILVLVKGKSMMESNLFKVFVIMLFSILVLAIFVYKGMVDWKAGLIIAIGQGLGGWVASTYIARDEKANQIAYFTLVIALILIVVKMFIFR